MIASPYTDERFGTMDDTMPSAMPVRETQHLWAEFGHRLRAFIARRVESDADADDILQEVFLRIHQHVGAVQRGERLTSWLFQVTRHAIVDYYRAPGRRRELPSGAGVDLERAGDYTVVGVAAGDADPAATPRELAACLKPMVDRLPPLYREAVTLVDLDGLPQKEAAGRTGVSLSGMKSRVQRGRQALGDLLQECCRLERDAGGRVTDYQVLGAGCGPCATGCGSDS